jgi:hypothetical protein
MCFRVCCKTENLNTNPITEDNTNTLFSMSWILNFSLSWGLQKHNFTHKKMFTKIWIHLHSRFHSSVSIETGYGLDGRGSNPGRGTIFLSYTASRPALGPTQAPIQWVLESLSLGVKQSGREAEHSLPSCAEFKNGGAILLSPHTSSWHGA